MDSNVNYEHTEKIPIQSWDYINDKVSIRPYERRPVITFQPDDYFAQVMLRNEGFIKVRIRGTKGIYEGDYFGSMIGPDKLMLITVWEGYPFLSNIGTIQILPKYTKADIPSTMTGYLAKTVDYRLLKN